MKALITAIFTLASASTAYAQDVMNGVYDGRSVAGWSYSPEISRANGNARIWAPSDGSVSVDGAHCVAGLSPGTPTLQEWQDRLGHHDAQSYLAELAPHVSWTLSSGATLSHLTANAHPVLRFGATVADTSGALTHLDIQEIGGAEAVVTLMCSTPGASYAGRRELIERFFSEFQILTRPPQ